MIVDNWTARVNSINDIEGTSWQGYYWMSDAERPISVDGNFKPDIKNNFIVEALMHDKIKNESIYITHCGTYQITHYKLDMVKDYIEPYDEKSYLPLRLENVKKINFVKVWLPQEDEHCEDMEVLTLKAIVFTGYKY